MKEHKIAQSFSLLFICLLALTGCRTAQSPGEKAFQYMEQAAQLESVFNAQQKPLIKEEQNEQKLYKDILALDMKQFGQIQAKSKQALSSIAKRKQLMKKEKESIDRAAVAFKKAEPFINQIKDKKQADIGKKVVKEMTNRNAAFNKLNTYYKNSLKADESLFKRLETKGLTVEMLQKTLNEVNTSYKKIDQEKDQFNRYTNQFNQDKKAFYKSMNINDE